MAQVLENLKNWCSEHQNRRFMKRFENLSKLSNAKKTDCIRWFELASNNERLQALEKHLKDQNVLSELWEKHWRIIAPYMSSLTREQFLQLLCDGNTNPLEKYLQKKTLSEPNSVLFIKHIDKRYEEETKDGQTVSAHTKCLKEKMIAHFKREHFTFSAKIVRQIAQCKNEEVRMSLHQLLTTQYHVSVVENGVDTDARNCISNNFVVYLYWLAATKTEMPDEAQIKLTIPQYEAMHSHGMHLSEAVIAECILTDDVKCYTIMQLEDIYPASKRIEEALLSNRKVYTYYQSAHLRRIDQQK